MKDVAAKCGLEQPSVANDLGQKAVKARHTVFSAVSRHDALFHFSHRRNVWLVIRAAKASGLDQKLAAMFLLFYLINTQLIFVIFVTPFIFLFLFDTSVALKR